MRSTSPFGIVAACLLAAAPSQEVLSRERDTVVNLSALRNKEELVLTVGDRLAIAAEKLCTRQAPGLGIALHDLSQYATGYHDAARPLFERVDLPAVLAVAREGAAARAGILAGDGVAAVDGDPVPPDGKDGLGRVEAVMARMQLAAAAGPVRLTLTHHGRQFDAVYMPPLACAVRFQVRPDPALDASTNGWLIEVTTGLADFVRDPDELAAVLAHELAHVILHHREAGRTSARQSRMFELDADRLAVRLARQAGFRPGAAADFWQRMRDRGGAGPSGLGRHPADRQRVETVRAALRALAADPVSPAAR